MKTTALRIGTISASTAGTGSTTFTWPSELFPVNMYQAMDVVISVGTFTGSGVTFSVQELISDVGYVETANSGTLTATGTTWLVASSSGITATTPTILAVDPRLGKGGQKQVVVTQANTIGTLGCSVYLIAFDGIS